jgi:hypothetical protein
VLTGDPTFDAAFAVSAPEPARVAELLGRPDLRSLVAAAISWFGAESVKLQNRRLVVTIPIHRLEPTQYRSFLELTAAIAQHFDRVVVKVRALGREHRALRGPRGPRCAYCHADVTGDEPDLVACERCSAVLHDGCWQELGRCPVFGCEGRSPERASVV